MLKWCYFSETIHNNWRKWKKENVIETQCGPTMHRTIERETLLPIPFDHRLQRIRMGLCNHATHLWGLLLRGWLSARLQTTSSAHLYHSNVIRGDWAMLLAAWIQQHVHVVFRSRFKHSFLEFTRDGSQ